MTPFTLWTTSLLALLAASTGVSGSEEHKAMRLVKRDPSGVPATVSHQNCATRYWKKFGSTPAEPTCNLGIQVGECYVNARIHNNVFATFEPQDGPMTSSREGGPYGICCAHNTMPKEEDLIEVKNANYFCFAWLGAGKEIGDGLPSGGLPGMSAIPFPLICPGPTPNCYSLEYFDPMQSGDNIAQHKLVSSGDLYPNTTAFWMPPKRPGKRNTKRPFLWCNGRGLGCPLTTNRLFQTQNLGNMGCDPTLCEKYKGDMSILQGNDRASQAVARGEAVAGIKSCDGKSDPWCGGPKKSGFGGGKGSGSSGGTGGSGSNGGSSNQPSCDTDKDPNCSGSPTTKPKKCDKKQDKNCDQSTTPPPTSCDPNVDDNCKPQSKTPPTQCDPSVDDTCPQGKDKSKNKNKSKPSKKKPKKCQKGDTSCDGYGNGGGSTSEQKNDFAASLDAKAISNCVTDNNNEQETKDIKRRSGDECTDSDTGEDPCDPDSLRKRLDQDVQQENNMKRDEEDCEESGIDCHHHRRHSLTHMKSGWIV